MGNKAYCFQNSLIAFESQKEISKSIRDVCKKKARTYYVNNKRKTKNSGCFGESCACLLEDLVQVFVSEKRNEY